MRVRVASTCTRPSPRTLSCDIFFIPWRVHFGEHGGVRGAAYRESRRQRERDWPTMAICGSVLYALSIPLGQRGDSPVDAMDRRGGGSTMNY